MAFLAFGFRWLFVAPLFGWILLAAAPLRGQSCFPISGAVFDDRGGPLAETSLRFTSETSSVSVETTSRADGRFSACLDEPGWQRLTATHAGYPQLRERVRIDRSEAHLELHLIAPSPLHQSMEIDDRPESLALSSATAQNTIDNREATNIPFQGRDLWPMLALMPGVVQDSIGRMHLGGSQINQVQCRLDGFTITNPMNGECDLHLDVNSIQTVAYAAGQYSAEFGKGSAGLLNIATRMGSDRFQYSVTNFVPGVDFHAGIHSGSWAPRLEASGPIVKRRAWFFESGGTDYLPSLIEDLPGKNQIWSLRLFNHLRAQVNLTPSSILHVALLGDAYTAPRFGLSVLNPDSTTVDRRSRAWFDSVKHTKFFSSGSTLEVGYAEYRSFGRQIPQGDGLLLITPFGELGNSFVNLKQSSRREQVIANYSFRKFHALGEHRVRLGGDAEDAFYSQDVSRTGYEHLGLQRELLNSTTFTGNGDFGRAAAAAALFAEDAWNINSRLLVTGGLRADWNELLRRTAGSPRAGVAYHWERLGLRLSAGYAVTRDSSFLPLFVQAYDQHSVTTSYNPDGTLAAPPTQTVSILNRTPLRFPAYRNWTAGIERNLFRNSSFKTTFLRRRGQDGLTYVASQAESTSTETVLSLQNYRRDVYDSAEFVFRQPAGKEHEWQVSYTRSRALSNAVVNLAVDTPVGIPLNVGPMPWDAPNRLMAWGYLPTPWPAWSIAALVETRSGFPFSVQDPAGITLGAIDSRRYPAYFDLDLHVEHTMRIAGHRIAIRAGATNVTSHLNPSQVENVIGAPQFLQFYGSRGRHFLFRIRWLDSRGK